MKQKLSLPSASSPRGAQMGRHNIWPANKNTSIKLRMQKLAMVDGDYDQWGAYWGYTAGTAIYCAWGDGEYEEFTTYAFIRAKSRLDAKNAIRENIPNARFYN